MRCIAQSSQEPSAVQIEQRGTIYDIWLRQNIHEVEATEETIDESGEVISQPYTYWEYDEAYMQAASRPEITDDNFAVWFEKADAWTEPVATAETAEDLLLELAADHEERICMLELLSEV